LVVVFESVEIEDHAFAVLPQLVVNQAADGGGTDSPGGAVLEVSDLPVVSSAVFLAADHLARVDYLAGYERTVEGHLPKDRGLVEFLLAPRISHQDVGTIESRAVDFTPHLLNMTAFKQADIARHNRRHMLARL